MLGRALVAALAERRGARRAVIATDVHPVADADRRAGIVYADHDVRTPGLQALLRAHAIDTVVHLASIVTPGPRDDRATSFAVDVEGTQRVLGACVAAGVKRLVVSSSGAAYGYHADNPPWLTEEMPLRGNDEFAYAQHKRLVEEMLAGARSAHPQLEQVVLRIGTILGAGLHNQITALFERARPLAIRGSASPFVFVWIDDAGVVGATAGELARRLGERAEETAARLEPRARPAQAALPRQRVRGEAQRGGILERGWSGGRRRGRLGDDRRGRDPERERG